MFQATCTECGERCEVPFKPSGGKPVLCKACFSQNGPAKTRDRDRDSRPSYGSDRSDSRGSDSRGSSSSNGPDLSKIQRQLSTIEAKLDQLLEMFEDMDEEEDEDDKD